MTYEAARKHFGLAPTDEIYLPAVEKMKQEGEAILVSRGCTRHLKMEWEPVVEACAAILEHCQGE